MPTGTNNLLMRLLLFAIVASLTCGCRAKSKTNDSPPDDQTPTDALTSPANVPPGAAVPRLEPGATLPALDCEGWINGPPPKFDGRSKQLVVVDVWARWCSEVPKASPRMVELYRRYKSRGVAFVSLTTEDKESVSRFVRTQNMSWPSGYGANINTIAKSGCYNSFATVPGYEIHPTVYLVDSRGRVLWNDLSGRTGHDDEKKMKWHAALEAAIVKHLPSLEAGKVD